MSDPLAYFLTWTTYGSWLPGDQRGWVLPGRDIQLPDPPRERAARARMTESPCVLNEEQRRIVETTVTNHCRIRGWELYAVTCRTNHVHVVVAASRSPDDMIDQFKAWGTRRLKEYELANRHVQADSVRRKWWAEGGSKRYLNDETSLDAAVRYVIECQDGSRFNSISELKDSQRV